MLSNLFKVFGLGKGTGNRKVVTRFAPSPTGFLHAGNYRTALFAYLYARKHKGSFILRIEDTDKVRSKKEYEENIIDSLKWLGLEYDAFYRQSDRSAIHASYIQKLIDSGHAYVSKETPKEPGDRAEVIRFKNPNKKVAWDDVIRGRIEFDTTELKDFVIARSMNEPVFHLVVVVDDHEMGVTHIIRGEDHISNTSRHILLYEALGFTLPTYAHLPLLLSPDRSKLSKRKGALPITTYRDRGFLPEAIVNYMALLGWSPGSGGDANMKDREIFSRAELTKLFDLTLIQKSGAIFSDEKLAWVNREYMKKLSNSDFTSYITRFAPELVSHPQFKTLLPLIREKVNSFGEVPALLSNGGELAFIHLDLTDQKNKLPYKREALMWRQEKDIQNTKKHLAKVLDLVKTIDTNAWSQAKVKSTIWPYAEEQGKGFVLWPTRYALSGQEKSPDPFVIAGILGKEETIHRLSVAHDALPS